MNKTSIEWTELTWNPMRGCSRVSEGCRHCYAERIAARFCGDYMAETGRGVLTEGKGFDSTSTRGPFAGFATPDGWTGGVELIKSKLTEPLRKRKPAVIFVNSMSDTFHEKVPGVDILSVLQTIGKCPRHRFLILTKRAKRARLFLRDRRWRNLGYSAAMGGNHYVSIIPGKHLESDETFLPNVALGVSCEDKQRADERIPDLLATPAAMRFVSLEPLLEDLGDLGLPHADEDGHCSRCGEIWPDEQETLERHACPPGFGPSLDWVVVGGESGPGARPMHPSWVRSVRDQCLAAGVPFFFKQWGEWLPQYQNRNVAVDLPNRRPQHTWDDGAYAHRVGKKAAGRLLDGKLWDQVPENW